MISHKVKHGKRNNNKNNIMTAKPGRQEKERTRNYKNDSPMVDKHDYKQTTKRRPKLGKRRIIYILCIYANTASKQQSQTIIDTTTTDYHGHNKQTTMDTTNKLSWTQRANYIPWTRKKQHRTTKQTNWQTKDIKTNETNRRAANRKHANNTPKNNQTNRNNYDKQSNQNETGREEKQHNTTQHTEVQPLMKAKQQHTKQTEHKQMK